MRRTFLLIAIGLLSTAVVADEKPQSFVAPARFVIPEQFQHKSAPEKLELIVDQVAGAAPAACPMDASVIMTEKDSRRTQVYSGTVIHSENGQSTILTCAHMLNRMQSPTFTAEHQKKVYPAKLLRRDDANDLVLLTVDAKLPVAELASEPPAVGHRVTSIGLTTDAKSLVEMTHDVARGEDGSQRSIETTGQQYPGRSGGGLFVNGALCGVIQGNNLHSGRALYVSLMPIREILSRSAAVGSGVHTDVEILMAPFHCPPCNRLQRVLGAGSETISVTPVVMPSDWIPSEGGFPFVRFNDVSGKTHVLYGIRDLDHLQRNIDEKNSQSMPTEAVASGASIQGKAIIESLFNWIETIAGPSASGKIHWHREGGEDALLVGKKHDKKGVFGEKGRIEFCWKTSNNLPIHEINFDYRFANGKFYFRPDEIEVEIPEDGVVGGSQPVGNPILIAWCVVSWGYDLYVLLHPSMDLYLGDDVNADIGFKNKELSVQFTGKKPKARLHWSFMFGLVSMEYQRAVTGALLNVERAIGQFHESRIYRDITIPVK